MQQTLRERIWGPRGPGAGRAHLRVVEQPQLVEPLRGGHGLTGLWPCCAPPVAASSAPPAGCPRPGPWAGGRHSGAERRYTAGGSPRLLTLSHLATKVYTPLLLLPAGHRLASYTWLSVAAATAPPLLGLCKGRGVKLEEEPGVWVAGEVAWSPASHRRSPFRATGGVISIFPGEGRVKASTEYRTYRAWNYRCSMKGMWFAWR